MNYYTQLISSIKPQFDDRFFVDLNVELKTKSNFEFTISSKHASKNKQKKNTAD